MRVPAAINFESIPIAGIVLELDGTIVAVNPAGAALAEAPAAQLIGRSIGDLSEQVRAKWDGLVATARSGGQAVEEALFEPRSGRKKVLQFVGSLIELDGRTRIQAYAIDITARKAAEDAARARSDADERLAAQQRLESLGLVAGGIAHDFNNLLVGVLAEASAAREDRTLAENTREALRRIEAAARRMAQLTRQLLAYSGRGQFTAVPVVPDELLVDLRESLTRMVRPEAQLVIEPGARAAVVEADAGLLRQVVMNLVSNASDAGGSRVTVVSRTVSRDGTPFWELEVKDDGAGIDAPTLARIFEPFFSTKAGRHGLGLSAVHGIVRRLGGDIEVDSRVGQGSRFRVHLPVALGAEPPAPVSPRMMSEPVTVVPKLTGIRALVADDEPSVRATVRRLLERRGATVVVAADGLEAEARLRDEQFHIVVSDVSMPGCSGYDVLVSARATQRDVKVVLMSGYTEKMRGEGGEEEPDAFLEKPFTAKVLDTTVDEVLQRG